MELTDSLKKLFGIYSVRIPAGIPDWYFCGFSSVLPDKFRDSTSIKPRSLPSKSFTIFQQPTFIATDYIVKFPQTVNCYVSVEMFVRLKPLSVPTRNFNIIFLTFLFNILKQLSYLTVFYGLDFENYASPFYERIGSFKPSLLCIWRDQWNCLLLLSLNY
jgi:hypothetical protein